METTHFIVIDFKSKVVAVALNKEELTLKLSCLSGQNNIVIEMESKHFMGTMTHREVCRKYASDYI